MLIAAGPVSVADNSLTSRGMGSQPEILGVTENEADQLALLMDGGACVFVYELGRSTLSSGTLSNLLPATNNRTERPMRPIPAFFRMVPAIPGQSLPEGRVLFHANQVTLEAKNSGSRPTSTIGSSERPMKVGGGVAIFSFDDVSLQDNQVLTEIREGLVYFDVAAVAPTVRASGNRFAEVPSGLAKMPLARYSYLSAGRLKNSATGNQATHCIGILGPDAIESNNQILFNALCNEPD